MSSTSLVQVTLTNKNTVNDPKSVLLTDLKWDDPDTADVNLILEDLTVVQAHRVKLGVCPLLKTMLTSLDVRLDLRPHISLQEFDKDAVTSLLTFIYRGEIVFTKKSKSVQEFMKLCRALRLNPTIIKKNISSTTVEVQDRGDLDVDEVGCSNDEAATQIIEENNTEISNAEMNDDTIPADDDYSTDDANDTIKDSTVIDDNEMNCDTGPLQDNSDDETTEHISDYLNHIMHNTNEKVTEAVDENEESEHIPFKMPDSFDIPAEYIQEMVPQTSQPSSQQQTVTNPFQISDEESESSSLVTSIDEPISIPPINFNTPFGNEDTNVVTASVAANEIMQTYKKEESIRPRGDHKKTKERKNVSHPKMNRRMLNLFGESDSDEEKDTREKESNLVPADSSQRTPTPTELKRDLEDKRKRVKRKLKMNEMEEKSSEKMKIRKKLSEQQHQRQHSKPAKDHICNSSCKCIKQKTLPEDDDFLVSDTHESFETSSDSDAAEPTPPSKKPKPKKLNITDSSSEDDDDEQKDELKKNKIAERKAALSLRGANEALSKIGGKPRVSIQNIVPNGLMVDRWQYVAQLDATQSEDSEPEQKSFQPAAAGDSASDSDVSIPKGKRFNSATKTDDDSQKKNRIKKKKKLKRFEPPAKVSNFSAEEVEVWTPSMYEKWDRLGRPKKRKQDFESDSKQRHHKMKKSSFSRSISLDVKSDEQQKVIRSSSTFATLESLGISHNYGAVTPPVKPLSSLPKIPKLKKPENL